MNNYVRNQESLLSQSFPSAIRRWCTKDSSTAIHPEIYNLEHYEILKVDVAADWRNPLSTLPRMQVKEHNLA